MIPPFGISSYKDDKTCLTKTDLFDFLSKKQYLTPSFKKDFWGELSKRGYKETRFETAAFEELEKIAQIILQKSFLEKKFESQYDFIPSPVKDYDKKIDADFNVQLQELENHGFPSAAAHKIRLGFHYFSIMENYYLKKLKLSPNEKANLLFQIRTRQQLYWMNLVFGDLNTLIKEAEEADRELNPDRITDLLPTAEETVSFPPLITANSIDTYALSVSKTARETVSGVVEVLTPGNSSQKHKDVPAKGKNGERVYALVDIKATNGIKIQDPTLLKDELFQNVFNGALSLYLAGYPGFTIPQLYKTCTQQTGNNIHPNPKTLERYEAIVEKMRTVNAEVDFSQEAQSWEWGKNILIESFKVDDAILPLRKVKAKYASGETTQYLFTTKPLLCSYLTLSEQIRYIPFKLINTTEAINNTPNTGVLKEFLLPLIEQGKKHPPVRINFDTIYARINSKADRTQQHRIRENTEKILSCFKKNGYIAAYKKYGPPGKEYGYEITPSPAITKK